ncbi:MAG: hypothetical protein VKJ05_06825 [Synechococcaceae cyanobacterium]|nr:hypothetical protein [Synechococcaceae cyanobacterium]
MSEPLALSLGQQFELERMSRAIDATLDPQALQGLAKQLLQAWHSQKAATQWVMRQQLGNARAFGGAEFDEGLLESLKPEPGGPSPGGIGSGASIPSRPSPDVL